MQWGLMPEGLMQPPAYGVRMSGEASDEAINSTRCVCVGESAVSNSCHAVCEGGGWGLEGVCDVGR